MYLFQSHEIREYVDAIVSSNAHQSLVNPFVKLCHHPSWEKVDVPRPSKPQNLKITRLTSHKFMDESGKPSTKTQFTQIEEEDSPDFPNSIGSLMSMEANSDLEEEEEILSKKTTGSGALLLPVPMKNKIRVLFLHGMCGYCQWRVTEKSKAALKIHLYQKHMMSQEKLPMECLEQGCIVKNFEVGEHVTIFGRLVM